MTATSAQLFEKWCKNWDMDPRIVRSLLEKKNRKNEYLKYTEEWQHEELMREIHAHIAGLDLVTLCTLFNIDIEIARKYEKKYPDLDNKQIIAKAWKTGRIKM